MKRVNWVFCLISACLLSFNVLLLQTAWGFETIRITSVHAQLSPSGLPTINTPLELPHRWDIAFPKTGGHAVYTAHLPAVKESQLMGIFIARLGNQATITLNEQLIAQLGELDAARSDYSKLPQWITIPSALLKSTAGSVNVLRIEITTQSGRWGGLSTIEFGTQDKLKPRYDSNFRIRTVMNLVIFLSFLLMGGIVLSLWLMQRESLYLIFVMAAGSGAFRTADRLITTPPLDWPLWGILYSSSLGVLVLSLCAFSLKLIGRLTPYEKWVLWWQAALTGICAALSLFIPNPALWTVALTALMPSCVYTLWRIIQACRVRHNHSAWLLMWVFVFLALVGFRDFIAVRWLASGMDTSSYFPHAMFVFVLVMAGLIVNRYSQHFQQAKKLTEHLSEEVRIKGEEIKLAYEVINEQTRENAIMIERQRMMSDIHDGVGAQLVGLVNQTQKSAYNQAQVREQASAALDELRMAVDALQPSEGDLLLVLATLRYRLEPRLKACGIVLVWQMQPLPSLAQLGSHQVIQIQRIVYQAVSNIIEHSQATTVTISAEIWAAEIAISIRDNGVGFEMQAAHQNSSARGIGLLSMAHRAKDIGATLNIRSQAGDTQIELVIKL